LKAELITIGDEILLGKIINTHVAYVGKKLSQIGVRLSTQTTVPDDREVLAETLTASLETSDVVITTGGLGPTKDDTTKSVLAEIFHTRLVKKQSVLDDLRDRYGPDLSPVVQTQAEVPESASIIMNSVGTAPGFIFEEGDKMLVALPGPPNELRPMFEGVVIPKLEARRSGGLFMEKVLRTIGVRESDVEQRVGQRLEKIPGLSYGLMAHPYQVDIRLFCTCETKQEGESILAEGEKLVEEELGKAIFTRDDRSLEEVVGEMLREAKKKVAFAESCTGGLIAKRITDISGSSEYFEGAFISYSNNWKETLLGVRQETLVAHGAVSEETAIEMAENVRQKAGADLGLSVTGIAGPTGGTPEKPVGLVYMALSDGQKSVAKKFNFRGDREWVRYRSSQAALNMIRKHLLQIGGAASTPSPAAEREQ
jgi:nicotinamide-nucleotide amidase